MDIYGAFKSAGKAIAVIVLIFVGKLGFNAITRSSSAPSVRIEPSALTGPYWEYSGDLGKYSIDFRVDRQMLAFDSDGNRTSQSWNFDGEEISFKLSGKKHEGRADFTSLGVTLTGTIDGTQRWSMIREQSD